MDRLVAENKSLVDGSAIGEYEEDPKALQLRLEAQIDADKKEVERKKRRAEVEAGLLVISAEFKDEFWPYLVDQLIEPPHMLKLLPEHENLLKMKDVNDPLIAAQKIAVMSHLKFIEEAVEASKLTFRGLKLGQVDMKQRFKCVFKIDDTTTFNSPKKCFLYKQNVLGCEPMPTFRFYSAAVRLRGSNDVYLEIAVTGQDSSLLPGDVVTLVFPPPPFMFEAHQDVVKCLQFDDEIRQKIFPSPSGLPLPRAQMAPPSLRNLNEVQCSVVDGLLNNDARFANLIVGPPGTGKTLTLAAGIVEIIKRGRMANKRPHILVVAHSNAAVDCVALALLNCPDLPSYLIRRVYCHSHKKRLVPVEIMKADITFRDKKPRGFYIPTNKATFAGHQITLCTIYVASRLKFLGKKFYSYIYIDEAARCLEMDSAIPLALFAGPNTSFSFFGDPNQLRPFFRDAILCQQQFDTEASTMERMQKLVDLQNAPIPSYFLNINYCSRSPIVEPFSTLFYNSKVVSQFVPNEASGRAQAIIKEFGGVTRFHVCDGEEEAVILGGKITYRNSKEMRLVEEYMKKLKNAGVYPRDVGIISPYHGQLAAITERVQKQYPHTWVSSVDRFQGLEKSVIILTTVKAKKIGLLGDFRCLNVAISRPRDLLIVIGSLELLGGDENWNAFGRMLLDMGAIYDEKKLGEEGQRYWQEMLCDANSLSVSNTQCSDEELIKDDNENVKF